MAEKIVIIGASDFQNPLILKAKEKGYETHVFAWQDGSVGEHTADYFYPVSITEKEKILETLLKDVSGLLEELYQSGFNTVHDSTLQEMEKAGKLAGQCGMEYLEGKMKALADGLSMRRHQLRAMPDKLAETYAELIEYLYLCRTKITLDMGRKFYQ